MDDTTRFRVAIHTSKGCLFVGRVSRDSPEAIFLESASEVVFCKSVDILSGDDINTAAASLPTIGDLISGRHDPIKISDIPCPYLCIPVTRIKEIYYLDENSMI